MSEAAEKSKEEYIYLPCVQSMNSIHVSVLVRLIISCMYRKLMDWSTVADTPNIMCKSKCPFLFVFSVIPFFVI